MVDFDDQPLFNALAYPCILIGKAISPAKDRAFKWLGPDQCRNPERALSSANISATKILQQSLTSEGWQFNVEERKRLTNLEWSTAPLSAWNGGIPVKRGILTGLNAAFVIPKEIALRLEKTDSSLRSYLKLYLRGKKDIQNSQCSFNDFYILAISSSANQRHPWSGLNKDAAESVFKKLHPALYQWFKPFRENLIIRADQGDYYWELRSCGFWADFRKPKVLIPTLCLNPEAAADTVGYCVNDKINFVLTGKPNLLAGLLIATATWNRLRETAATRQNGYIEVKPLYLNNLPIPVLPHEANEAISDLMAKYNSASRSSSQHSSLIDDIDHIIASA